MTDEREPLCAMLDPEMWKRSGEPCMVCDEPVNEDEPRLPMLKAAVTLHKSASQIIRPELESRSTWVHRECAMRSVLGGALHIEERCSCFVEGGPIDTDPPGLSRRDQARAAYTAWLRRFGN